MMYLLYNFVLTLLSPVWAPWMLWRTWKRKEQPNWQERTGNLPLKPKDPAPRIWFHAVSVGEVIAAKPILAELKRLLPNYQIVLSVTTSSGHRTATELDPPVFDTLVYFPIDVARFQLIAMQKVQPKAVVVMETELWFNFLWAAKIFDAKTFLVNGRISDRSFPRSMKIRFFYKALLRYVDSALMQTEIDRERIQSLGATSAKVLGNCKFDQALEGIGADPSVWKERLHLPANAKVVVVGSTRGEVEERLVMEAIGDVWDLGVWVIHAPRHIEACSRILEGAQKRFGEARLFTGDQESRYLVVDVYGILAEIYSVADVVIVGGGFENLGGQNVIQPLAHGKPVLHGPHMQNFRESTSMADRAEAAATCATGQELGQKLRALLENPELCQRMGQRARELVNENVGASRRYAEAIRDALNG
jgi:3-deoxy-D-manno-octulosonic-acid transferase